MSEPAPRNPSPWSWNARNLTALVALLAVLGLIVGWRYVRDSVLLDKDLTVNPAPLAPLGEKIDPNTASWASLARLPDIGPGRARAIVTYRERYVLSHPGQMAFTGLADLEKVPRIGPTLAQGIGPYLTFPVATQPASAPILGQPGKAGSQE